LLLVDVPVAVMAYSANGASSFLVLDRDRRV
jgi:hypothetical protein